MSIRRNWFSADLHLGHQRVIELCNRPFESVEEMNAAIVDNFNDVAGTPEDRLILLGDICMGKLVDSLEWLGKLKAGEVVLVPGNHDRWSLSYEHRGDAGAKREEFRRVYEKALGGRGITMADWTPSEWLGLFSLTGGWDDVNGPLADVKFSHYPYVSGSTDEDHGHEARYAWAQPKDEGHPLVCGHVHGDWAERGRMFNVGVDVREFKPVPEEEIEAWVSSLV